MVPGDCGKDVSDRQGLRGETQGALSGERKSAIVFTKQQKTGLGERFLYVDWNQKVRLKTLRGQRICLIVCQHLNIARVFQHCVTFQAQTASYFNGNKRKHKYLEII